MECQNCKKNRVGMMKRCVVRDEYYCGFDGQNERQGSCYAAHLLNCEKCLAREEHREV
jgi:hypothetical protein